MRIWITAILAFLLLFACKDVQETKEIYYTELTGISIPFPDSNDDKLEITFDVNDDGLDDFTILTYNEKEYLNNQQDSVIRKVAYLQTSGEIELAAVWCHIQGGLPVEIELGDTINEQILNCFPEYYDKCGCGWEEGCYLYKYYPGIQNYKAANYIAIRKSTGGGNFYGWLRIEVDGDIFMREFAISRVPNKDIYCGQIE